MPVTFEYQTHIQCDCAECLNSTATMMHVADAKKYFRSMGWKIGNTVTCPECAAQKKESA